MQEYILNNAQAWEFAPLATEDADDRLRQQDQWRNHLAWLDTAILSLLGD